MPRRDKINYYLDIADTVSERSTCQRIHYGSIIVKDDEIVSTGYNGAPRARKNCGEVGCLRQKLGIPSGERYELCRSVHAEANAIISAARRDMLGASIFLSARSGDTSELLKNRSSCSMCRRLIINAGIKTVYIRETENEYTVVDVQKDWIDNDDSLLDA